MFVAASPLTTNITAEIFGAILPVIMSTFVVQDSLPEGSTINASTLHVWNITDQVSWQYFGVNTSYYLEYKGSTNLMRASLALSNCLPTNVTSMPVTLQVDNKFKDPDTFNPTAPDTLVDDSEVLNEFSDVLVFQIWIEITWIGASQCQLEYMEMLRDELQSIREVIIWYSESDYWTGDIHDFREAAADVIERRDTLRDSVAGEIAQELIDDTSAYETHQFYIGQMDVIIVEMDEINRLIEGLLQDNITAIYYVIVTFDPKYVWSERLEDKTTNHYLTLITTLLNECHGVKFPTRYSSSMGLGCELRKFQTDEDERVVFGSLKVRMEGERSEMHDFAQREDLYTLMQQQMNCVIHAEEEPAEVYWQNAQFMLWVPLYLLFSFAGILTCVMIGLAIKYQVQQCRTKPDTRSHLQRLVQQSIEKHKHELNRQRAEKPSHAMEMTIF